MSESDAEPPSADNPPRRALGLPRVAPELILRPRVHALLERRAPLTALVAPRGYGKTTATANWLDRSVREADRVAWLDPGLEKYDDELLWAALLRALGEPDGEPTRARVRQRLQELAGRLYVVVNGAEKLTRADLLDRLVDLLRREERVHVIVTTSELWRPYADLAHQVPTVLIDAADLQLLATETVSLFDRYGIADAERYLPVHEAAQGWPALVHRVVLGVVEATRSGAAGATFGARMWAENDEALTGLEEQCLDFVLDHLLPDGLDDDDLALAVRAALVARLDTTNQHLLDPEARPPDEVAEGLDRLVRSGLLHRRPGGELTMPDLVRRALRRTAPRRLGGAADPMQRRFCEVYIAQEDWITALRQALSLDDRTLVLDVIDRGWQVVTVWRPDLVEQSLARIPADELPRTMAMDGARVWSQGQFVAREAEPMPQEAALRRERARSVGAGQFVGEQLMSMCNVRLLGRVREADRLGVQIVEVLTETLSARRDDVAAIAGIVYLQCAISRQLASSWLEAEPLLRLAADHVQQDLTGLVGQNAAGSIAQSLAAAGRCVEAGEWLARAEQHPPLPGWLGRRTLTPQRVARAWLAVDAFDPATAIDNLAGMRPEDDPDELWAWALEVRSAYELLWGDSLQMIDDLKRYRRDHTAWLEPGSHADRVLSLAMVDQQLALGQGTAAAESLARVRARTPEAAVRRARLALLLGQPRESLAEPPQTSPVSLRARTELALVRAGALLDLGETEQASSVLLRVVDRIRRQGPRSVLTALPVRHLERLAELAPETADVLAPVLNGEPFSTYPPVVEQILLTTRERVILTSLATGESAEVIARRNFVSVNTVKTQTRSLYRKLRVNSRADALIRARELGIPL